MKKGEKVRKEIKEEILKGEGKGLLDINKFIYSDTQNMFIYKCDKEGKVTSI